MGYKDKEIARNYAKEAMAKKRQGITNVIPDPQDVIPDVIPFVIPDGMVEGITGVTDIHGGWHWFGAAYYRALAKQRGDAVEETPPGYGWIDFIKSCTPEFLRDIELAGVRRGDRKARYERVYRYWLKSQGIKVEPAPDKRLTKLSQALDRDLSGLMGKENMLDLVFRGALSMRQTRAPGT